jgi:hypothetical protein
VTKRAIKTAVNFKMDASKDYEMRNGDALKRRFTLPGGERQLAADKSLHPAWSAFMRYCAELQHGEIELLKIQDGLPVLAEVVKKKVKFVG